MQVAMLQETEPPISVLVSMLKLPQLETPLNVLLANFTVAEASLYLARVCKSARDAVRAFEQWRPMWNREHAVARLRAHYDRDWYGPSLFPKLESLARLLLDELQPNGVILLRFSLPGARDGRRRSLLGCDELRVLKPDKWVERLKNWALFDDPDDAAEQDRRMRGPSQYIIDLLRNMHLQRVRKFDKRVVVAPADVLADPLCWYVWENNLMDY
jgi:hypothetical protein